MKEAIVILGGMAVLSLIAVVQILLKMKKDDKKLKDKVSE